MFSILSFHPAAQIFQKLQSSYHEPQLLGSSNLNFPQNLLCRISTHIKSAVRNLRRLFGKVCFQSSYRMSNAKMLYFNLQRPTHSNREKKQKYVLGQMLRLIFQPKLPRCLMVRYVTLNKFLLLLFGMFQTRDEIRNASQI